MKIGMYTEDEIFEYMTDCEGSMLGRSMYDAIFDKIHGLITENKQLKEENKNLKKKLEHKDNIQITFQQIVEKKCKKEVDFIKYLNNCIKELQKESTNKLQNTLNLGIADVTKEILSKYKEIIESED